MSRRLRWFAVGFVACVLAFVTLGRAQQSSTSTTSLRGTVVDNTGGVLPGAAVVVKNLATGVSKQMDTNRSGLYSFPSLDIGTYTVTISLQGYKKTEYTGDGAIRLYAGIPAELKTTLQTGSMAESVQSKGTIDLVRTPGALGTTVSLGAVSGLPRIEAPSPAGQTPSAAPPAATVVVRFPAGKSTYHVGEEIPLELEFRGKAGRDYYFTTESYDRSGRMSTERYDVTPADGTDDPLADMLSYGGIGGGLFSRHPLDDTPFVLHVSLNDWVRFNRPGTFRLVVTSHRLLHGAPEAPVLVSAPVDLTITPTDDAWAASELQRALQLIGRGDQANVRLGATILRYLGTEAAAKVQVERYSAIQAVDGWSAAAGVMSSPHRALIVHDMEAHVDAGELVDPGYIATLVQVKLLLEMPRGTGDPKVRADRRAALQADYDRRWRAAMTRTPMTAAKLGAELDRLRFGRNDDLERQVTTDLDRYPDESRAAFIALPAIAQRGLLEGRWPLLGDRPWMASALREIYNASHGGPGGAQAGDSALRRLTELKPDEGRVLILEEIRTSSHGIGYDALAVLPDKTLPELDDALLARSRTRLSPQTANMDGELAFWLIARYGSPALMPAVAGAFTGNRCRQAAPQLAYLSKTDPEAAVKQLQACDMVPFAALGTRYWDDRFEAEAIRRLDHADAQQAGSAAQNLGEKGSAAVKAPLLDRLKRWSEEWRGRAPELASMPATPPNSSPPFVEFSLVYGLFTNKHVTLTLDDAAKIRALCVTDSCRREVDMRSKSVR